METIQDILAEYPSLQNPQSGFAEDQLLAAMERVKSLGKKELLQELKGTCIEVNPVRIRGQKPKFYLSSGFIEREMSKL